MAAAMHAVVGPACARQRPEAKRWKVAQPPVQSPAPARRFSAEVGFPLATCSFQVRGKTRSSAVASTRTHAVVAAILDASSIVGNFETFAASDQFIPFMRSALAYVEGDLGLSSYHLRVVPWLGGSAGGPGGRRKQRDELHSIFEERADAGSVAAAAAATGFLLFVAGDNSRRRDVPSMSEMDNLDAPISYEDASGKRVEVSDVTVRDTIVWGAGASTAADAAAAPAASAAKDGEDEGAAVVRCGLDFQGRPSLVVVLAPLAAQGDVDPAERVVRRQSELCDGTLAAFWRMAARVVVHHGGFEDMRLNAGAFQNVAHLHLKVFIDDDAFAQVWSKHPVFLKLREARQQRAHVVRQQQDQQRPQQDRQQKPEQSKHSRSLIEPKFGTRTGTR